MAEVSSYVVAGVKLLVEGTSCQHGNTSHEFKGLAIQQRISAGFAFQVH